MAKDDLEYCRGRIVEETLQAQSAPSPEAAEKHLQMAMLYRAQLAVLTRAARRPEERVTSFISAAA
jgi:hypothetical protein